MLLLLLLLLFLSRVILYCIKAPPIPPTPILHVSQDRSFSASVSATSECNGPLRYCFSFNVHVIYFIIRGYEN